MTTEKSRAFGAALEELFRRYPLPEYKYQKTKWKRENDRETAVRNARAGGDLFLVSIFLDRSVPHKEVETLRNLIFG